MDNIIPAIFVFFLGWVVVYIGIYIFAYPGDIQDIAAIMLSIWYLAAVITYFSLKIIDVLNKKNKWKWKVTVMKFEYICIVNIIENKI